MQINERKQLKRWVIEWMGDGFITATAPLTPKYIRVSYTAVRNSSHQSSFHL